ncbi:MAG: hypothetical protein EBE86_008585 [Hormoscilla sp. GUM202]|nr:hypothetical protein [Hormoscilla sp. GUM202]
MGNSAADSRWWLSARAIAWKPCWTTGDCLLFGKGQKKEYARLGVKYYIIYAPRRRLRPRLTVYNLENGKQISDTSLN